MTASQDTERLIRTFLEDGPTELREGRYDAVRAGIDGTGQRVVIGPWRTFDVQTFAKLAAGIAAVLIVTVVGVNLFGGGPSTGSAPSPNPTSTPSSSPIETPTMLPSPVARPDAVPPDGTSLTSNGYAFYGSDGARTVRVGFSDADGWISRDWYISSGDAGPAANAALATWGWSPSRGPVTRVYDDPCPVAGTAFSPLPMGATVDDLVSALVQQERRTTEPPTEVTVGDYSGVLLETVLEGAPFADCASDHLVPWRSSGGMERWVEAGTTQRIYILDVEGTRLVIEGSYLPTTQPDQLFAIMSSLQVTVE